MRATLLALLVAAGGSLARTAPAYAQDQCSGVPDCVIVSSGSIHLDHLQTVTRVLDCPSDAQYSWKGAWDKSSTAVTVADDVGNIFRPESGSFTATNWSVLHDNTVQFYLGCSASYPPWENPSAPRPPRR